MIRSNIYLLRKYCVSLAAFIKNGGYDAKKCAILCISGQSFTRNGPIAGTIRSIVRSILANGRASLSIPAPVLANEEVSLSIHAPVLANEGTSLSIHAPVLANEGASLSIFRSILANGEATLSILLASLANRLTTLCIDALILANAASKLPAFLKNSSIAFKIVAVLSIRGP